jgi:sRNA-binding protein
MTTRANKQATARAAITLLSELYPKTFFVHQARRRPIKVNIHIDIIPTVNGAIRPHELVLALRAYTSNSVYLSHMRTGVTRIGLNGEPAGIVTAEAAKAAAEKLATRLLKAGARKKTAVAMPPRETAVSAAASEKTVFERGKPLVSAKPVKPVPFEKFKSDWLLQLAADSKLTLSALKIAIAISSHMNRKRGGLPRSKKIKVLRWRDNRFFQEFIRFFADGVHQRLTARPSTKGSRSASCALLSRQRDVIEAAHVQPFALLERKAIGSPQTLQSALAVLKRIAAQNVAE